MKDRWSFAPLVAMGSPSDLQVGLAWQGLRANRKAACRDCGACPAES
jgi:hypothetical protein